MRKELESLKFILDEENPSPVASKVSYSTPHYEFEISIGEKHSASVIISEEAYYELLERAEFE